MSNAFSTSEAPYTEPDIIVKGDFVQWKRQNLAVDYPSSAYSAAYVARDASGGAHEFTVNGTVDDNDWYFAIPSATSAGFDAAHHHWQLEITRTADSERLTLRRGSFEIVEDYDNNVDPRSHAEKMVDKIESILLGRADADVASYSINGRSLTKIAPNELREWRDYYRAEVAQDKRRERVINGKKTAATIKVRF